MIPSHTFNALKWIIEIIKDQRVPYRISGGFAANYHGTTRKLADIDIDLSKEGFEEVIASVSPYHLVSGPERYKDKHWNCQLATLDYKGQKIDLMVADDALIYNAETGMWEKYPWDCESYDFGMVDHALYRMIPKVVLIKYKDILRREVDLLDVRELS